LDFAIQIICHKLLEVVHAEIDRYGFEQLLSSVAECGKTFLTWISQASQI
jgi:hypothetical protein